MKKLSGLFITGTDTGVGKTTTAVNILERLNHRGYRTAASKPIETGCLETTQGLRGKDAVALQAAANFKCTYDEINPYPFLPPIAPHIAAAQTKQNLSVDMLMNSTQALIKKLNLHHLDYLFVEGVGGFQVPLNANETMADFATALKFPILLIVGLRLGCLNMARLTFESIQKRSLPFAGWIACAIDPDMLCVSENIKYLETYLGPQFCISEL